MSEDINNRQSEEDYNSQTDEQMGELPHFDDNDEKDQYFIADKDQDLFSAEKKQTFIGSGNATNLDGLDHDQILKVIEQEVNADNVEDDDFDLMYDDSII